MSQFRSSSYMPQTGFASTLASRTQQQPSYTNYQQQQPAQVYQSAAQRQPYFEASASTRQPGYQPLQTRDQLIDAILRRLDDFTDTQVKELYDYVSEVGSEGEFWLNGNAESEENEPEPNPAFAYTQVRSPHLLTNHLGPQFSTTRPPASYRG
jgi:hypothetical protein